MRGAWRRGWMMTLSSASDGAAARIRGLPIWPAPPDLAPCPGGRTNENFRVATGGRIYFARVGADLPHHGVTRANEARCCRLAAAAGIGPAVLHAEDGILVTDFVPGRTLVQGAPINDTTLARLAEALRRLHAAPAPADLAPFDPVAISRRDLTALPVDTVAPARRDLALSMLAAAPILAAHCLIHADLIPENVIVAADRLAIVDWEYSGYGDGAVDLASVMVHFGLDARQTALLVARHGAVSLDKVRAIGPVLAVREALWCEVQMRAVGPRGDLPAYTEMCWRRLESARP